MESDFTRRHSRWFERILLSYFFQFCSGIIVLVGFTAIPIWGIEFWKVSDPNVYSSLLSSVIAFFFSTFILRNLFRLPGSETVSYVLPVTAITFGIPLVIILIRRESYSIQVFLVGFFVTLCWCLMGYFLGRRYRLVRYAILPFGEARELVGSNKTIFSILDKPNLLGQRFNAIVADFNSSDIPAEWEKFLARCTLARIPVYSTKKIRENMYGRVKIDHLNENAFGSLLPSSSYEYIKRIIDFTCAAILLPLLCPLLILIALFVKFESAGSALFIQERMGFRGKIFKMLKFRTMYVGSKGYGFTSPNEDPRVTKLGVYLRKYRIDELPQIINVLLGQMSFIGPRPESFELSQWYEKDVPFFAYRHVVRPGISGWAQVEQGYAAEVDGMKIKLEYDFYYIKNFSFWLDLLIAFKSVKTILTGFGSR